MKNKLLKNLKAIASYALALAVVVSSLGIVPAVQANVVSTPTLTIGSQSASNGATINVPINASNFANAVAGIDFVVQYDPALLTYIGLTQNAISGHGLLTTGTNSNTITINWFDSAALSIDSGDILTLNFTVISSATVNANLIFPVISVEMPGLTSNTGDRITPTSFVGGIISLNADVTSPEILSSYPVDNSVGVSVNAQPTLTFSEALDPATINGENIELREYATLSSDAKKVPAALTYSTTGNIVTFILSSPLQYNKQYYFWVGTGVKDVSGNSFAAGTWYHDQRANHEFTTEAVILSSLEITTPVNKLSYTVGDLLDITGLVITGHYSDGSTQIEPITAADVSGFDSSAPATGQILTITFGGKTLTYAVNISAAPVPDTTAPIITLIGNATVNLTVDNSYTDAGATASDNIDGDITYKIVTINPVNTSVVGVYTVTYNVSDAAGNPALEVTRTVNVTPETTAPTLNITGFTANGHAMTSNVANGYILNTIGNASTNYLIQFTDGSVASEVLKSENVELKLQPTEGQTANLQAYYSTNYPEIYEAYLKDAAAGNKPFAYIKTDGTAIRLLDGAQKTLADTESDMIVPDNYPAGTYTVKGTIHDLANNEAEVTFILVVAPDTTAPIITLTGKADMNLIIGSAYEELGATTDDGSAVNITGSVDQDTLGDYVLTYNSTDEAGNIATPVTRTIHVIPVPDTTAPIITIGDYSTAPTNADITVNATTNEGTLNVSSHTFTANGSFDFVATDAAGNITTKTVTITNIDKEAPVITLVGETAITITVGDSYSEQGATWTDNVDGTGNADISGTVDINTVGVYTIKYNKTDSVGNAAVEKTRTITVNAKPAPVAPPAPSNGGGGGSYTARPCVSVTYSAWGACVNGVQYRNVLSQSPNYCALTASQQAAKTESCGVAPVVQAPVVTTPVVITTPAAVQKVLGVKAYANGTLIRGTDKKIYVVSNGTLIHVATLKQLAKYAGKEIINVDDSIITSYQKGEVLGVQVYANGTLIRGTDKKIYVIVNGKKQHINSLKELAKYAGKEIFNVADSVITQY